MTEKTAKIVEALYDALVNQIRNNLTPDLLKPGMGRDDNPMAGHCYVASEALYHLLGGKESGWFPVRKRMPDGVVHWWLANSDGDVLDPTHDQFDNPVPYSEGRPGGFLTREPSKRAQELMNRVQNKTATTIDVKHYDDRGFKMHGGGYPFFYFPKLDQLVVLPYPAYHTDLIRLLDSRQRTQLRTVRNYFGDELDPDNVEWVAGRIAVDALGQHTGDVDIYAPEMSFDDRIKWSNRLQPIVDAELGKSIPLTTKDDIPQYYDDSYEPESLGEYGDLPAMSGYEQQKDAAYSSLVLSNIETLPDVFQPHTHDIDNRRTFVYLVPTDTLYIAPNNAYHSDIWDWLFQNRSDEYDQLWDSKFKDAFKDGAVALGFVDWDNESHAPECRMYWAEGNDRLPAHILDELSHYFGRRVYQSDWQYPTDWTQIIDMPDPHDEEPTAQWPGDAREPFEYNSTWRMADLPWADDITTEDRQQQKDDSDVAWDWNGPAKGTFISHAIPYCIIDDQMYVGDERNQLYHGDLLHALKQQGFSISDLKNAAWGWIDPSTEEVLPHSDFTGVTNWHNEDMVRDLWPERIQIEAIRAYLRHGEALAKIASKDPAFIYDPATDKFYTGPFHRNIIRENPELHDKFKNTSEPDQFGMSQYESPLVFGLYEPMWDDEPMIHSDYGTSTIDDPAAEQRALELANRYYTKQSKWKLAEYRGLHTPPSPDPESRNTMDDLSDIYPDDIYGPNGARYYGHGGENPQMDEQMVGLLRSVKGNPDAPVTIYRAAPEGVNRINPGDWVTPMREYAQMHGESNLGGFDRDGEWQPNPYVILEQQARAGDLYTSGDSIHEWGWHPQAKTTSWKLATTVLQRDNPVNDHFEGWEIDDGDEPYHAQVFQRWIHDGLAAPDAPIMAGRGDDTDVWAYFSNEHEPRALEHAQEYLRNRSASLTTMYREASQRWLLLDDGRLEISPADSHIQMTRDLGIDPYSVVAGGEIEDDGTVAIFFPNKNFEKYRRQVMRLLNDHSRENTVETTRTQYTQTPTQSSSKPLPLVTASVPPDFASNGNKDQIGYEDGTIISYSSRQASVESQTWDGIDLSLWMPLRSMQVSEASVSTDSESPREGQEGSHLSRHDERGEAISWRAMQGLWNRGISNTAIPSPRSIYQGGHSREASSQCDQDKILAGSRQVRSALSFVPRPQAPVTPKGYQTLPSRVPPADSGKHIFATDGTFNLSDTQDTSDSETLSEDVPVFDSIVRVPRTEVPRFENVRPWLYDFPHKTLFIGDEGTAHKDVIRFMKGHGYSFPDYVQDSIDLHDAFTAGAYDDITGNTMQYGGRDISDSSLNAIREQIEQFLNGQNERDSLTAKVATTLEYCPEEGSLIDSDRTPIVYDPDLDRLYVGQPGGSHPSIFRKAIGEALHMGQIPHTNRKDVYERMSAGLYDPGFGPEWFYGPSVPEHVNQMILENQKGVVESHIAAPQIKLQYVPMQTSPDVDYGGDIPVLFDQGTGTLYYGDPNSMHKDLTKAAIGTKIDGADLNMNQRLKHNYQAGIAKGPGDVYWLQDPGDVVKNFVNEMTYNWFGHQASRLAMAPLRVSWVGNPSKTSAIWVWHIPTNHLIFGNMFEAYHMTIMRELEPNRKIKDMFSDFLLGEIDDVGGTPEVSNRDGTPYQNQEVANAVIKAWNQTKQAKIAAENPDLHSWIYFTDTGQLLISDNESFVNHREVLRLNGMSSKDLKNRPFVAGQIWFARVWDEEQGDYVMRASLTVESDYLSYVDMEAGGYETPDPYDVRPQRAIKAVIEWFKEHYPGMHLYLNGDVLAKTANVQWLDDDPWAPDTDRDWTAFIYINGNLYLSQKMIHPRMMRALGLRATDLKNDETMAGWLHPAAGVGSVYSWDENELNEGQDVNRSWALKQKIQDMLQEVFPGIKLVDQHSYHSLVNDWEYENDPANFQHDSKVGKYYEYVEEQNAESRWGGLPFIITHEGRLIIGDDPEEHHKQLARQVGLRATDIATAGIIYPNGTFTILWGWDGDVDELGEMLTDDVPDSVWDEGYNLDFNNPFDGIEGDHPFHSRFELANQNW